MFYESLDRRNEENRCARAQIRRCSAIDMALFLGGIKAYLNVTSIKFICHEHASL